MRAWMRASCVYASLLAAGCAGEVAGPIAEPEVQIQALYCEQKRDVRVEREARSSRQIMWIADRMMRVEDLSSRGGVKIVRADRGLIWDVRMDKRVYRQTTFDELRRAAAERRRELARTWTPQKLELLPARKRDVVRKMLGTLQVAVEKKETGSGRRIAGFDCKEVVVTEDGAERVKLWIAPALKAPAVIWDVMDLSDELLPGVLAALRSLEGFPLETTVVVDSLEESVGKSSVIARVQIVTVSSRVFEVPPGFEKTSSGED